MGYDMNTVGNIHTTIRSLKKETSSKVLGTIFKGEFQNTLQKISQEDYYANYLKDHLNDLLLLIEQGTVSYVVAQILQTFTKYNKSLGDWIISKILNINCSGKQVNLLYDLIKCNPREFITRLKIVQEFIFNRCKELQMKEKVEPKDLLSLEPFMNTFIDLVSINTKNLQIDEWSNQVLKKEELKEKDKVSLNKFIGK